MNKSSTMLEVTASVQSTRRSPDKRRRPPAPTLTPRSKPLPQTPAQPITPEAQQLRYIHLNMPAMQSNPIQSKQSYFVTESMYVTCAAAGSYQYPFRKFGKVGKGRGWLWGSCARSARQWMAPKSKGGVGVRRGRLLVHAVYVDCSTPVTRGGRKGTNTQRRCLIRQVRQKASIAAQPARLYRQGWCHCGGLNRHRQIIDPFALFSPLKFGRVRCCLSACLYVGVWDAG